MAAYVDIENLRSAKHARASVEAVLRDWPDALPGVGRLCLYPPADKAGLWCAWASRIPGINVRFRGVQRFARESKNSADIAIVAEPRGLDPVPRRSLVERGLLDVVRTVERLP